MILYFKLVFNIPDDLIQFL